MDSSAPLDPADPAPLLQRADALRDARDWIEAAIAYAAYLRARPQDWPIWVQYGHCMKESGDVKAALLLYREAERLQPGDSDLHLQIGHALKLLGRVEEAYLAYARALTLDPENAAARAELLTAPGGQAPPAPPAIPMAAPPPAGPLPSPAPEPPPPPDTAPPAPPAAAVAEAAPLPSTPAVAEPAPRPPAPPPPAPAPAPAAPEPAALPEAEPLPEGGLVFDASDLVDYFRANRAPTGIQRVQLNILLAALDQAPEAAIAVFDAATGAWKRLPEATFRRLADLSRSGADAAAPDWAGAVANTVAALLQGPPLAFPARGRLVNLGTSWWIPDYLRRVREAKDRAPGLRYIPFLHDCIPLAVPEHCASGLVDEFARWFAGLCLHADLVLCNSAATEADFRRFARLVLPEAAPTIRTAVVPLDAVAPPAGAALAEADIPRPVRAGRPFVLAVGTIESRKNHLMLFQAWLALLRRHGAEATPDLVCVGKRGWLAEPALALHANSPLLQEKVHLLHGVADAALEALYRACLFTVQASHYEGWGLPVTESLAHGKLALVPAHTGYRESGAAGAVFFQPGSEPELVAALERLSFDAPARAALEQQLRETFRSRDWASLTAALLAAAGPGVAPLPPPLERLPPRLGTVHAPRLLPGPVPEPAMAVAEALREGPHWSVPEPWGCWTLPGPARLRLPVEPGRRGPVRLHLALLGPPGAPVRVALRPVLPEAPPAPYRVVGIAAGERVACTLDLAEAGEGRGVIEIDCAEGVLLGGEGAARDLRSVGVGVTAVMACRPDDLAARLAWLEALALPRLVRL